jgi:hypothetical protein
VRNGKVRSIANYNRCMVENWSRGREITVSCREVRRSAKIRDPRPGLTTHGEVHEGADEGGLVEGGWCGAGAGQLLLRSGGDGVQGRRRVLAEGLSVAWNHQMLRRWRRTP